MSVLELVWLELKRLVATPMAALALAALLAVPVMYAGLYLWGNDDPYGDLGSVPVALVVEDEGAEQGGERVDYGEQVAAQLLEDRQVGWVRVDARTAEEGVRDGRFDFVLTFGPEFSSALTSASGDTPRQAVLELTTDDTNSFLATTIAGQVADRVRDSIAETVGTEAALTFLDGFATIRSDLETASGGAAELASGAGQALSGAQQLAAGAVSADGGADALAAGLSQIQAGSAALPGQAAQLDAGAQQIAAGNGRLAAVSAEIAAVTSAAAGDVPVVRAEIVQRLTALGVPQADIDAIMAVLDRLGTAVVDGNGRVAAANAQIQALATGSAQLAGATSQLAAAAPALAGGIASASSGAAELAAGTQQLADGLSGLQGGLATLDDGLGTLAQGLADGLDQVPDNTPDERQAIASVVASPVSVDTTPVTSAATYGAGLAPFFICLSAWIGIYALFLIVRPLSDRALTAWGRPALAVTAGWLAPALLGIVQMLAVFTVVRFALGYEVHDVWGMFGLMAFTSVTFAAMLLALNILLGAVGQFLGLALLVLQLVTAGGTFPWQTLPPPLAALHHVLPMGHAVDGVRQLMYGGTAAFALNDALILGAWLLGALAVSYLGAARLARRRLMFDMTPSIYV